LSFLIFDEILTLHRWHLNKVKAYSFHGVVDIRLAHRLLDLGKSPVVNLLDNGVRDAQDITSRLALLDIVLKELNRGGRGDDEKASADSVSQIPVEVVNKASVQHSVLVLLVVEDHHAIRTQVAVQLNPGNLMPLIPALKEF